MKKLILLSFFFITSSPFFAQSFGFEFDYAKFRFDDTSNFIEFYYYFPQNQLTITKEDTLFKVQGYLSIVIKDNTSDEIIVDREWFVANESADIEKLEIDNSLVGVLGFKIPEGNFTMEVTGKDTKNEVSQRKFTETFTVNSYDEENMSMSDIQLASNIKQDAVNKESIFYKNTFEVIPNPTMVFGETSPMLFYYAELYNLTTATEENKLKIISSVINHNQREVLHRDRLISKASGSRVEVGTFNISKLQTGSYTLVISVIDSANNYGIASSKRFFVFNPSVEVVEERMFSDTDFPGSEFAVLSEEECDDLFEKSRYISSSNEIKQFETLENLNAKREFLFRFWSDRARTMQIERGELRKDYIRRVDIANERFGNIQRVGWKTDRGRVYISYGEPSEIERYPNQLDSKPYEIWHYNHLEGGVIFIFADLTGFSDYMLLHSTMRGEMRDDNWQRKVASF